MSYNKCEMIRRNGPINVKMDRKTANALKAQAKSRGLSVNDYLQQIAAAGRNKKQPTGTISSGKELDAALEEFFAMHPEKLPALPKDFSRTDIYNDHD